MNIYGIFLEEKDGKKILTTYCAQTNNDAIMLFDTFINALKTNSDFFSYKLFECRKIGEWTGHVILQKDIFIKQYSPRWEMAEADNARKIKRLRGTYVIHQNFEQMRLQHKLEHNQAELVKYIFDGSFLA